MSTAFVLCPPAQCKPIAPLRRSRMRALEQTKLSSLNKLRATISTTPLKRSISYDSDGENVAPVAPVIKFDSTKRKRGADDDNDRQLSESPKALKASRISLATEASTSRKANAPTIKPAGRSPQPKSKYGKAFGRRSQRDLLPPNTFRQQVNATHKRATGSRKTAAPPSWFFHIHVDTPDEEATNTMQHFAGRLDISDDDDEGKVKYDDRGKENIPPHELGLALPTLAQPAVLASRKNMMSQSRSPLGELDASDYYSPGLHGLSYAVIYDGAKVAEECDKIGTKAVQPTQEAALA